MPPGPEPAPGPALTCTTPDGVELAVYDFGGTGPDLLLVHATGFCAGVLLPLARALSDRFRCHALDLRGHGRSGRPADGDFAWSGFGTDVLTVVDRLGLERPSGFGHSCGGAVAAAGRAGPSRAPSPASTSSSPWWCPTQTVPFPPQENPLSLGARRRRDDLPVRPRTPTSTSPPSPRSTTSTPKCCNATSRTASRSVPADQGGDGHEVRLRCRRDDEAEIYATAFDNGVFARLPEVRCPATFAYGKDTDAFGRRIMEADAARVPRATVEAFPASATSDRSSGPASWPPACLALVRPT